MTPNEKELEPQNNFLTTNWLVGVLMFVVFVLLGAYFTSQSNAQAAINSNVQNQIAGIQSQLSKQTAILILIATKQGIPTSEITNLTQ